MIPHISGSVIEHPGHGQRVHGRQTTGDLPEEQKHVQLTNQNRLSIKRNDSPFILQPNLCSKVA